MLVSPAKVGPTISKLMFPSFFITNLYVVSVLVLTKATTCVTSLLGKRAVLVSLNCFPSLSSGRQASALLFSGSLDLGTASTYRHTHAPSPSEEITAQRIFAVMLAGWTGPPTAVLPA